MIMIARALVRVTLKKCKLKLTAIDFQISFADIYQRVNFSVQEDNAHG